MSKRIEIVIEEWGSTNTIQYWVTGYTQATRDIAKTLDECMVILEGAVKDYLAATSPPTDLPRTADDWEKILTEISQKKGEGNE